MTEEERLRQRFDANHLVPLLDTIPIFKTVAQRATHDGANGFGSKWWCFRGAFFLREAMTRAASSRSRIGRIA